MSYKLVLVTFLADKKLLLHKINEPYDRFIHIRLASNVVVEYLVPN